MSDEPKTKELPAADPIAILTKMLGDGLKNIDSRLDSQDGKLDKVVTEGIEANVRLTRIEVRVDGAEQRVGELEGRIGRTSMRIQESSKVDLEQASALAQEKIAREELAVKVDTLLAIGERLDRLTKNPIAKAIATIIALALVSYAASKGIVIK